MKKALITGVSGQDGSYLAEYLLRKGYRVYGMRTHSNSMDGNLSTIHNFGQEAKSRFSIVNADLRDEEQLEGLIADIAPDEVYHLAGQGNSNKSYLIPISTGDINGLGSARLLESIRKAGLTKCRLFHASSAELYGTPLKSPQDENTPFTPRSPYGVAKLYAHSLVRSYREEHGMYAVNGILFNHESPRRPISFVSRKISMAAANIAQGGTDILRLGNLSAKRDWGYAGDYVEAMHLMLQETYPSDFVIATGIATSVRILTKMMFQSAGMEIEFRGEGPKEAGYIIENLNDNHGFKVGAKVVVVDPALYKPEENVTVVGNAQKALEQLDWAPKYTLTSLVDKMVKHDMHLLVNQLGKSKLLVAEK